MPEIVWLLEETIIAIHHRQIAEHGGNEGLRDEGLLSSALDRPQNLFAYSKPSPDLAALAAAYAFGIVRNHFADHRCNPQSSKHSARCSMCNFVLFVPLCGPIWSLAR